MLKLFRVCREAGGDGGGGAGDAGTGAGAAGGNTTVKVDHQAGGDSGYTPPTIDMATALPPEYREKPSFKGKDFVTLVKEHDNLQTLLGQRPAGIPTENSTDEEWGKFLGAMRPKDLAEYTLPETEYSKSVKRTPEYEKAIREIMAEVGVPKKLFGKGVEKIEAFLLNGKKGADAMQAEAAKTRDAEFETLLDTTYGKNKQVVTDRAKKLMVDSVPAELKEKVTSVLSNISNDTLFALTAVLDGIHAKYIAEDGPIGGGNPPGGDPSALQAEAEGIMKSPEYKDWRNPGHENAKQKVQEIFKRIGAMKK